MYLYRKMWKFFYFCHPLCVKAEDYNTFLWNTCQKYQPISIPYLTDSTNRLSEISPDIWRKLSARIQWPSGLRGKLLASNTYSNWFQSVKTKSLDFLFASYTTNQRSSIKSKCARPLTNDSIANNGTHSVLIGTPGSNWKVKTAEVVSRVDFCLFIFVQTIVFVKCVKNCLKFNRTKQIQTQFCFPLFFPLTKSHRVSVHAQNEMNWSERRKKNCYKTIFNLRVFIMKSQAVSCSLIVCWPGRFDIWEKKAFIFMEYLLRVYVNFEGENVRYSCHIYAEKLHFMWLIDNNSNFNCIQQTDSRQPFDWQTICRFFVT